MANYYTICAQNIFCTNSYYRSAQECRAESEIMEKRLLDLAEEQERLAEALNEVCNREETCRLGRALNEVCNREDIFRLGRGKERLAKL